jgi:hypothetical protein
MSFAWFRFLWNPDYGLDVSLEEFSKAHSFSAKAADYLDRLARLTDGAGIDRYSLNQFISFLDHTSFYRIYIQRDPNDILLFPPWQKFLVDSGVTLVFEASISEIIEGGVKTKDGTEFKGDQVIFAVPPTYLNLVLKQSSAAFRDAFGPSKEFSDYSLATKYIDYLTFEFQWDRKVVIPDTKGFPVTPWDLAFVVLSDYFESYREKTLITAVVSFFDVKAPRLGKTVNECSAEELKQEVFLQLKDVFPDLEAPDRILQSPGDQFDQENKAWETYDWAFVRTARAPVLPAQSPVCSWLFTVGTHNAKSPFHLTSMESAVANAVSFGHEFWPGTEKVYPLQVPWSLTGVLDVTVEALFAVAVVMYVVMCWAL